MTGRTWIAALWLAALVGPSWGQGLGDGLTQVKSVADLDRLAGLHFAIMSDHKGDSPLSSVEFARMAAWTQQSKAAFVVGLGDHLKYPWENTFIDWIGGQPWWRQHCFLNVADGENEYYSPTHRQSDYGAGAPLLNLLELDANAQIEQPNPSEYYARIPVGDYTVHLLQMHYSDQPEDAAVAFPEASRAWMMETLAGIDKGARDLVLVAAHSRRGSWDMVLNPPRRRTLFAKADLILSATTHSFKAWVPEGFADDSGVCVNTGAVNYTGWMTPNGYVEIHVLAASGALVGQYMDLGQTQRQLQPAPFAWVKPKDGPMRLLDWPALAKDEDPPLAQLERTVGIDELKGELAALLRHKTGADLAFIDVRDSLAAGPVGRRQAWGVFHKNRNLRVIQVPRARVDTVLTAFGREPVDFTGDYLRIAAPHPYMGGIIQHGGLSYTAVEPQSIDQPGLREVDLLAEWLAGR
ncbi:MAG: hypothetical protein GKR89_02175 [Candidatus Latescibacteria bacterium]|nr:hypothetical protein [Candidatus Latescibacterota bacterium]